MMIKTGMKVANSLLRQLGTVVYADKTTIAVQDGLGRVHEWVLEDCVPADGYRAQAAVLFNVDYFQVTPAQRQAGKRFAFHKTYSMRGMKSR